MHLVSQALAWLRAAVCGAPGSSRADCDRTAEVGTRLPVPCPSPLMWSAILAGARRRRAPHLWPPVERPAIGDIGALVRVYVLPEDERTRVLASPVGRAR